MVSCMTDMLQSTTGLEHELIRKVAEIIYSVTSLGPFFRCARYRPKESMPYCREMSGSDGVRVLFYALLDTVKLWHAAGVLWFISKMTVYPVLSLVASGR